MNSSPLPLPLGRTDFSKPSQAPAERRTGAAVSPSPLPQGSERTLQRDDIRHLQASSAVDGKGPSSASAADTRAPAYYYGSSNGSRPIRRRGVEETASGAAVQGLSPVALLRLRELFAAFIGVTLAYTTINFIFVNITGGCLVLFGLLSGVWCFVDRQFSTYILNAVLQLLLCITLAVAVAVHFPGFETYSSDAVLRSISIAHVPLSFLFAALSLYLAFVEGGPSAPPPADARSNSSSSILR